MSNRSTEEDSQEEEWVDDPDDPYQGLVDDNGDWVDGDVEYVPLVYDDQDEQAEDEPQGEGADDGDDDGQPEPKPEPGFRLADPHSNRGSCVPGRAGRLAHPRAVRAYEFSLKFFINS